MEDRELTRLYSDHAQSLYGFLSYRTGDCVLAEDLLAETFERVLRTRNGYDRRKASERTWLYAIALNCVRDNARRVAAETRALSRVGADYAEQPSHAGELEGFELRDAVQMALGALRPEEREAVALRFGADLTLADIASILDEPRSRIESRLYRGLKKLRASLGSDF